MKLAVRKVYCPKCQKLSHVSEENTTTGIRFVCQKCKTVIWTKENYAWRHVKAED